MTSSVASVSSVVETRGRICEIARSWLGTPYHHMGRLKGAGVDCAMFPLEVYREAGLIGDIEVPYYPADWMLHRSEEIYLSIVQQHARETEPAAVAAFEVQRRGPLPPSQQPQHRRLPGALVPQAVLPGDFVIYRFGRCFAHGAIVIDWPTVIHAVNGKGVILSDGEREGFLIGRQKRFFSLFHGRRKN